MSQNLGYASPFLPPTQHPGQHMPMPIVFQDDFVTGGTGTTVGGKFATTANAAQWLNSTDNSGTCIISDAEPGGVLALTPGTSANDYVSIQLNGEAFALAAGRTIMWEARLKISDVDDAKFFVGLASTDASTSATAGPVLDGTNDSIGFRNVLGNTATFLYVVEDDTSETTGTAYTGAADDTFMVLRFEVQGLDQVRFYVNGDLVATVKTGLPDSGAALTPTFEIGSPTGTTATVMEIDYINLVSTR